MTLYGMTEGLALGVICATFTFTLQTSRHVYPIRGQMSAKTLRSSRWRPTKDLEVLNQFTKSIHVIQLKGHLFFGNATVLAAEVQKLVTGANKFSTGDLNCQPVDKIRFVILDFTLVVGIDSSAAETISKLFSICQKYDVKLCYSRGSKNGFPCTFPLTEKLKLMSQSDTIETAEHTQCTKCGAASICSISFKCFVCGSSQHKYVNKLMYVSDDLDNGLAWCEDVLLAEERKRSKTNLLENGEESPMKHIPLHLQQIYILSGEPYAGIYKHNFTPCSVIFTCINLYEIFVLNVMHIKWIEFT